MKNKIEIPYKKLLMIQIILDGSSRAQLLSSFPPMHPNVFAHHITVAFKPSVEQAARLAEECGREVDINIAGEASDENCQAVLVSGVDSNNKMPHITISCADGVKPVYSNELLEKTPKHELVMQNMSLKGILTFVTKSQKKYQQPVEIV